MARKKIIVAKVLRRKKGKIIIADLENANFKFIKVLRIFF